MHLFQTPWLSSSTPTRSEAARRTHFARQARRLVLLEQLVVLPDAPLVLQTWILQRLELHDAESRNAKAA